MVLLVFAVVSERAGVDVGGGVGAVVRVGAVVGVGVSVGVGAVVGARVGVRCMVCPNGWICDTIGIGARKDRRAIWSIGGSGASRRGGGGWSTSILGMWISGWDFLVGHGEEAGRGGGGAY